ncbi:type I polyketide synthase [Actinoplanes sp. DH11]|uniref:type I polyketide synthase n=1 Tax=Actinoplanes sp. DH11 TaxID=2857011 RepID=UPI001E5D8719|nr:type I polyketide synthase [Actinoplanes sp. DH11]
MTDEEKLRYFLKRVTADLQETKGRLRAAGARDREPIAITAVACRFPGGVSTPEQLWDLVLNGTDALSPFPTDRGWSLDGVFARDPKDEARGNTLEGGFIYDIPQFDPEFFGISPREALAMDPQQRLLLEGAWEAVERAGIDMATLRGTRTGVFVGIAGQGYGGNMYPPEGTEIYIGTGTTPSVASGRIAYTFGLNGPAVTIDTACSSSLVALHLACQSLRWEECSMALVGAATLMAAPNTFTEFSRQGGLSSSGRCKAFSADADGTGWGEGLGVLLVERLSDARRNGRPILAVVRGSAMNQDGASNGLTAPSGRAQRDVIRHALINAQLSPAQIDAVEAHGTGTVLGDPIEAQALVAEYGGDRPDGRPLWLGSVKSNIGHTQSAAGMAGLVKMIMALGHGTLPATLHVENPSEYVDWNAGSLALLHRPQPWPQTGQPRRAGVSSFGVSGTNAHVILEQAPESEPVEAEWAEPTPLTGPTVPVPVSGASAEALRAQAARLRGHLAEHPDISPADLAFSLATTRAALSHRAVVLATDRESLIDGIGALAQGAERSHLRTGVTDRRTRPVFVFPGQGAQWAGMAKGLWASSEVFAAAMEQCAEALAGHVDWSLRDVVDRGDYDRVDVVQPVSWAVMVSLARLWESCGVRPAAVIGHSQGEIAAAVVAGALGLADGARVVALRSRAIRRLAGDGGMVSVSAPVDDIELGDGLSVAAVNGPRSVIVSGRPAALEALLAACEARGVRAKRIAVDYASHSPQVDRIRDDIGTALAGLSPRTGDVPFFSTLTGDELDTAGLDAGYWFRNLRSTVAFETAVRAALRAGHRVFIEVSSHPVLGIGLQETVEAAVGDAVLVSTLRRDEDEAARFAAALADAHLGGVRLDWPAVLASHRPRRVRLPTYAFQRRRFWIHDDAPLPPPLPAAGTAVPDDPFWAAVDNDDLDALTGLVQATDDPGARAVLGDVLPLLSGWRRRIREQGTSDDWRYEVTWRPSRASAPMPRGTWLVVVPESHAGDGTAGHCAEALAACGAEAISLVVAAGELDRAELTARLRGTPAVAGVLSLLALDDRPHPDEPAVPRSLAGTVALVQALGAAGIDAPLWCLTRGAVSTGPNDPLTAPAQATVWGLGRVAALEHPDRWGGLIDLPAILDSRAAALVVEALSGAGGEDQLAVRPGGVFVRRLDRRPLGGRPPARSWKPRGTVLVTGGTGALGGQVARWLAYGGAEHLLLVSRSGERAPNADALRAELTALGPAVTIAACDVGDREALRAVLDAVPADLPLTALVHTAAALDDSLIDGLDVPRLGRALHAKAAAAWNLHELTADRELDAFVLFSSFGGIVGTPGQGNYAPGNAYLDALALHRRALGLTATSVAWGAWGGGGMAEGDFGATLNRHGLREMDPAPATAALHRAIEQDEACVLIADIIWERFAVAFTATRPSPLLADLPDVRELAGADGAAGPPGAEPSRLLQELAGRTEAEQRGVLLEMVRGQAAQVLGFGGPEAVSAKRAFQELGLDSVTAVELRNRLSAKTGLRLPVTLAFDYPAPERLAAFLREQLVQDGETAVVTALAELDRVGTVLGGVTFDDTGRERLAQRLTQMITELRGDGDEAPAVGATIEGASDEEMFELLGKRFGIS